MSAPDIEDNLRRLGRATEPRVSLVRTVMNRVEQVNRTQELINRHSNQWFGIYRTAAGIFAAVAACVGAIVLVLHFAQTPKPTSPIVKLPPQTIPADQNEDSIPRLIDYQRAFKESPQALEALLQRRPFESYSGNERAIRVADEMRPDLHLN